MKNAGITLEELMMENLVATQKWLTWFASSPAALDVPCDIYNSGTVRGLLKHIFAVELRHSQRLLGQEVVAYDAIPVGSLDDLSSVHLQGGNNLKTFLAEANEGALEEIIALQTVSAGTLHASRRKLFVHILLHSMRHWAQLATVLREAGFKTDWPKDFLFSEAMK
ncbi:MAG TPA: DinB family protein [Acidobacteriaceae bacterium]|nr:DinB family protein [Acidobacteriaceae bacterium]